MVATVSRPIADPLGDARTALGEIKTTIARLLRENAELRARIILAERMALPAPLRTEHALSLLDQAAEGAEGSTPYEFLADVWNRFMALLDGSFEWDALAPDGVQHDG